jgi:excisionase family DNA binding protein
MSGQYITVRETAQILGVTEKKVMDLIEGRQLQAYKIADQFLRLKRAEVMQIRSSGDVPSEVIQHEYTAADKIKDFLYFNDFYILAAVAILILLYIIFFTH